MNSRVTTVTLVLCLAMVIVNEANGLSGLRCQCVKSGPFINPKLIMNLEYIPEGAQCKRPEIIATLKKDYRRICLDPADLKVSSMVKMLKMRNETLATAPKRLGKGRQN